MGNTSVVGSSVMLGEMLELSSQVLHNARCRLAVDKLSPTVS
jgi:hypothetical protein